ncbi:helix-turn-helix domain-containing protein [uncultured Azohydromonas sp.]|uniref:helix-turn-helix domain-containing protein n=1 Tax=uncultured Azohydromonas sp. TaxID=487342 RepID=UPI0026308451|nr:helix-turn-helix domain-containing protein [uncultured Azohydromonas sp.]
MPMPSNDPRDTPAPPAPWLPQLPFIATPQARIARARERFFGEGVRPTGLVSEAVLQSWMRCAARGHSHADAPEIARVSALRLDSALRRTRALREAARVELERLAATLGPTAASLLLADAQGIVVQASAPFAGPREALGRRVACPGMDVSEAALGTNAPALALRTGHLCRIDGGEHFFDQVAVMRCAAAPIRDLHGRLAGVLNLALEQRDLGFDPALLVTLHAAGIERRLALAQSALHTVLEMHVLPETLGTPSAGLVGLDDDGGVAWANTAARRLVSALDGAGAQPAEAVLGLKPGELRRLGERDVPFPLPVPHGLCLWARVRLPAGQRRLVPVATLAETTGGGAADATAGPAVEPASAPAPVPQAEAPSLAAQERALIRRTLQECRGNVSAAARRLGISRGRIYRQLAESEAGAPVAPAG